MRSVESVLDSLGCANCVTWILKVLEEDGEFVSTEPCKGVVSRFVIRTRDHVIVAQKASQSFAYLNNKIIPDRVSQAIIHHLEAVNVNKQYGEFVVGMAFCADKFMLQAVQEQRAIGQIG